MNVTMTLTSHHTDTQPCCQDGTQPCCQDGPPPGHYAEEHEDLHAYAQEAAQAECAQATGLPQGMYGRRGWSVRCGMWEVIGDYRDAMRADLIPASHGMGPRSLVEDGAPLEDYTPFHDMGPTAARRLLDILPSEQMTDRQNMGPTLGACLRACVEASGRLRLSGYAIGPQRHDERMTVEGIWIMDRDLLDLELCEIHEPGCQCRELWDAVQDTYGLDARRRPDEMRHALRYWNHGEEGTWLWWD